MERVEFDFSKLKGRIKEKLNTQENFAKEMNISIPSLIKKINNKSQFTQTEINKARIILDISNSELSEYFFKEKVKKT